MNDIPFFGVDGYVPQENAKSTGSLWVFAAIGIAMLLLIVAVWKLMKTPKLNEEEMKDLEQEEEEKSSNLSSFLFQNKIWTTPKGERYTDEEILKKIQRDRDKS